MKRFSPSRIAISLCILLLCFFAGVPAKAQTLQTTYDTQGLSSLKYNNVTLYDKNAGVGSGFEVRGAVWGDPHTDSWVNNSTGKILTWTYAWGRVSCQYIEPANSSRLDLKITVTNTTSSARSGLNIIPVTVKFPRIPDGYDLGTPRGSSNSQGPTLQTAKYGSGNLTVLNQDVTGDLLVGFLSENSSQPIYNVYVGSTPYQYGSNQWPQFDRIIPANSSDTYRISLRFSPNGADTIAVASDIYAAYAAANPFQLNWTDRRPIGALFLADPPGSESNIPATNPRGWNPHDGLSTVNITTPAGVADFKDRVIKLAKRSVAILKDTDAQGVITWDIEGAEFPHSITYIGDPRLVTNLAPEMDSIADAYFREFTNAGFRVGICIRPQQLRNNYGNGAEITPSTPKSSISYPNQNGSSIYDQLVKKIDYAKNRWGCTLFYIDSNEPYLMQDVIAIRDLAANRPDVLLIPENDNFSYYPYSAPYTDTQNLVSLQNGGVFPGTPPEVKRVYPNAFSAIKIGYKTSEFDSLRSQVVDSVRNGDVLVFNAWYENADNGRLKSIYAEAYPLRVTTTADVTDPNDGKVSLREAILYANSHAGPDNITFARSAEGTIKLNGTALPTLTGDCFMNGGNVVTVDGDGKSRIMKIAAGTNVTVRGLYFTNGKASGSDNNGGAFYNDGNLTIVNSEIRSSAAFYGGGLFNTGYASLVNSTFSGNSAIDSGAGVSNIGTITIENCTVSGNSVLSSGTGGAGVDSYGTGASVNLKFCTITANTGANATANARAGIWMEGGSNLLIANTIVYGNGTRDIQHDTTNVSSGGYNIVGSKGTATGFLASDKIGVNPLLGSLQNNGGPTFTHAIASGSPAINAGNPNVTSPVTDQRGTVPRVVNGRADIGSFESNFGTPSISGSLTASPSSSSGSS